MTLVLGKLYGIEPLLEAKLKAQGIKDTDDLLLACATEGRIHELAGKTDIDVAVIRRLVNRAEFARIRGIGEAYTILLEAAGVNNTGDLARQAPDELRSAFNRINNEMKIVGRVPALAMVNGWVNKAQRMYRLN